MANPTIPSRTFLARTSFDTYGIERSFELVVDLGVSLPPAVHIADLIN
jgi:hypothetical protein